MLTPLLQKTKIGKMAMAVEFNALVRNNTCQLVPYRDDMNLLSYKWVYCIKYNLDASIKRRKARLVVRYFAQLAGLNYNESFSPIVKHNTIGTLLFIDLTNE